MKTLNLLAFDLGASNGRGILGRFDGERIEMEELHRFENNYVGLNGINYWGTINIFHQMKQCIRAMRQIGEKRLDAFGIDTWGVDFGLLDKNGQMLGNPRCYRNYVENDMTETWKKISHEELFAHTGIATMNFNTIYQLYRRVRENDAALLSADCMLLMPDLLGYFFTGDKVSEYTNVTTTMLYNNEKKDWDSEFIERLGIPGNIFTKIDIAGTRRGNMLPAIAEELDINEAPLAAVGTHDTASAVAAIPSSGSFAFCSSGTWSLFGTETDEPVLSNYVYESNFSNEGTVQGGYRPLKNIMGLWLIQECRRDWIRQYKRDISWNEIVEAAKAAEPLKTIIDPDYSEFFGTGHMVQRIQKYCGRMGEPVPEGIGQIARCIYESLALKYRWAIERLDEIKGERVDALHIVGGGIQNKMLNQMAADSIGRPVITGPVEGACIGNLLMQAVALGELGGIEDVRRVVKNSVEVVTYEPNQTNAWNDAYERLLRLIKAEQ